MTAPSVKPVVRYVGVVAIAIVGMVHLQQWDGLLHSVPTINTLFLLNAIGATSVALALTGLRGPLCAVAALGGIAISIGSFVLILIAENGSIFGYSETSWRLPIVIAVIAEVVATAALLPLTVGSLGEAAGLRSDQGNPPD